MSLSAASVRECAFVKQKFLASSGSIDVFAHDDVVAYYFHDLDSSSIALAVDHTQIAVQHHDCSNFDVQLIWGKARRSLSVQIFNEFVGGMHRKAIEWVVVVWLVNCCEDV